MKAVLGSAVLRMVEPGIASPLLHICSRRYLPVMLAVAHNPFPLVEPSLSLIGVHQVVYALLPGHAVDSEKVLEQDRLLPPIPGEEIMLRLVAGLAETLEAHQVLMACLLIELPGFVAVHPALTSTNLAAITSLTVYRTAKAVPLAAQQEIGQTGPP